jgi:hypothetical protein
MAKNNKIDLPRKDEGGTPYLSYSQIATWKRSKRDYIRQYFLGEGFDGNQYTDLGKKVGEALENNDFSDFSRDERKLLLQLPRLDSFERMIRLEFPEGFYIKGFIDTNSSDFKHIIDYKTGDMGKRTEYDNDDYYQLEIYALALEQETGVLPDKAEVVLIERLGNAFKGETLVLGSQFEIIDRSLDVFRLETVRQDVLKIALEISEYYEAFKQLCK